MEFLRKYYHDFAHVCRDNGSLNLSANRSMVENRLSHQQQSLETAFTFTAGGSRKHKSPVSILPHTASSSMLLPSQQPSTSQVTFYSSENSIGVRI